MKRLIKTSDRPRENRRTVEFLLSMRLDIDNSDGDAVDNLSKFKHWVTNSFTEWDASILEHFLYQYGLLQNEDSDKYFLDFKIEQITKDDTTKDKYQDLEKDKSLDLDDNM